MKGRHSLVAIFVRLQHSVSPESVLDASRAAVQWFAEHPEGSMVKQLFRELLTTGFARLKGQDSTQPMPEELKEVVTMLARQVEKWERDIEKRAGRKEGASMLTRQLQHRFGTLPDGITKKIANADLSSLEAWSLQILDAKSLEEVFSGG